jgi:peptidyl-prolyl cis-trans isomerase SurA
MNIRSTFLSTLLALALTIPGLARAQNNLFTPAVFVNDRVITRYEVEQNRLFLRVLRQAGDIDKLAVERLIEDRLRQDAAEAMRISATPEEVEAGMAEFAGRANLTTEQFLQAIAQDGVAPDTFRTFVESGLVWREVVRTRFGPRAQVADSEIDRALALSSRQSGVQILLSEVVLPANTPEASARSQDIAQRLAGKTMSEGAFAAEARTSSASPSRDRGGRLDWLPLGNLPPPIANQVIGLAPGQVSQPIPVTNAIVLFFMRDLRETEAPERNVVALDWAEVAVANLAEAEKVMAEIDTCDDLYGVAKGLPEDRLLREVRATAEVPSDVALALAKLDDNEVSEGFSRNGQPIVLMLCSRTYEIPGFSQRPVTADGESQGEVDPETGEPIAAAPVPTGPNRDQIRARLLSQRLNAYADGYLAELRADASIRYQ